MKRFFFRTKRIIVRNFKYKDIDKEYQSWFDGNNENLKFSRHYKKKYNRNALIKNLKNFLDSKNIFLGIFDTSTKTIIGTITVYIKKETKCGDLGIFIGNKNYFSKGYALESCQMVIKFMIQKKIVNSIVCGAKNENIKMIDLMKKLKMKKIKKKNTLYTAYVISKII